MKNKKLKATLSITGYFLLLLALCFVGVLVFHSYYYESVYISGASMSPTLTGDDHEHEGSIVDFGIVDTHKSAINHIKRFDIVSTYYPDDYASGKLVSNARKKIKRVIAMPGETFTIKDGLLSVKEGEEFVSVPYSFKITLNTYKDTQDPVTLDENEYWVLGDNRTSATSSRDCATLNRPIKKEYIAGVLVAIEGQAKLKQVAKQCDTCGRKYKNASGVVCPNCSGTLNPVYGLKNKQYHWPKFF